MNTLWRGMALFLFKKACDVMDCADGGYTHRRCPALDLVQLGSFEDAWFSHEIAASLLLDGLAVEDLP